MEAYKRSLWDRYCYSGVLSKEKKTNTRKATNAHGFCRGSPLAAPRAI